MKITNPQNDIFDIIILAGQSNMEGNGRGESEYRYISTEDIMILEDPYTTSAEKGRKGKDVVVMKNNGEGVISVADERIDSEGVRCARLALSFADCYRAEKKAQNRKILLVDTSVGGTGFDGEHWVRGGVLFNRMLDMVDSAISMNPENRVVAFLWHQGEHDAYECRESSAAEIEDFYLENFKILTDTVRKKYGQTLPIVAAGFSHSWMDEYPEQNAAVISAARRHLSDVGYARYITDTLDLATNDEAVGNGDTVHFSRPALYTLGKRYYSAYRSIVDS